ncbi:MAG TPA: hypothetical protein VFV00_07515 [Acidimicrobiales bacterium]|nr:hypothetical protein [Acidimicrobiales bacterium]
MIHTCPRCELRFATSAELEEHSQLDHHADPGTFERFHYKPLAHRPHGTRFLVIANQTLTDDALLDKIRQLVGSGGHVHLVVPATASNPAAADVDDSTLPLATFRMRRAIERLHELGVDAEGEVGVPDPLTAVAHAQQHEPADQIVVSTLPVATSHWLKVDLPTALQRRFGIPVTVITADTHPA